jgi:hypothetical protein
MATATYTRPLCLIAREIADDWSLTAGGSAIPYIHAMLTLDSITDRYGMDGADEIVLRFLVNAKTWRGETARRIKKELKAML